MPRLILNHTGATVGASEAEGIDDEDPISLSRVAVAKLASSNALNSKHFKILPRGGWRQSVAARDILVAAHQGRRKQRRPLASICWTVAARLLLARRRRTGKRRRSTELLRHMSHTAVVAACYVEKERGREGRGPHAALSTATGSLAAAESNDDLEDFENNVDSMGNDDPEFEANVYQNVEFDGEMSSQSSTANQEEMRARKGKTQIEEHALPKTKEEEALGYKAKMEWTKKIVKEAAMTPLSLEDLSTMNLSHTRRIRNEAKATKKKMTKSRNVAAQPSAPSSSSATPQPTTPLRQTQVSLENQPYSPLILSPNDSIFSESVAPSAKDPTPTQSSSLPVAPSRFTKVTNWKSMQGFQYELHLE
nr:uncharacterized protein LOC109187013 [Ipomoea batatas]